MSSKQVTVLRNHGYKALFDVPWPASMAASTSVVLEKLVDAGFDKVTVRDLGHGKYEAEGVWPHPDNTADVDYLAWIQDLGEVS